MDRDRAVRHFSLVNCAVHIMQHPQYCPQPDRRAPISLPNAASEGSECRGDLQQDCNLPVRLGGSPVMVSTKENERCLEAAHEARANCVRTCYLRSETLCGLRTPPE